MSKITDRIKELFAKAAEEQNHSVLVYTPEKCATMTEWDADFPNNTAEGEPVPMLEGTIKLGDGPIHELKSITIDSANIALGANGTLSIGANAIPQWSGKVQGGKLIPGQQLTVKTAIKDQFGNIIKDQKVVFTLPPGADEIDVRLGLPGYPDVQMSQVPMTDSGADAVKSLMSVIAGLRNELAVAESEIISQKATIQDLITYSDPDTDGVSLKGINPSA